MFAVLAWTPWVAVEREFVLVWFAETGWIRKKVFSVVSFGMHENTLRACSRE